MWFAHTLFISVYMEEEMWVTGKEMPATVATADTVKNNFGMDK